MTRCAASHICWFKGCKSSSSTMIFTVRVRNGSTLTNIFSEAQTCPQCSATNRSLSYWRWKLSFQDFRLLNISILVRELSSLLYWIRAFLQPPLRFTVLRSCISKLWDHILGAWLRGSDHAYFMRLINANKSTHGLHGVNNVGRLYRFHGKKWRAKTKWWMFRYKRAL